MSKIRNLIVLLSAALCAGAADIYTVTETITSGGIDLTALGPEYRQDAIAGRATGANEPIAITGRVVHASDLTPQNPFVVSNITSSSYFILKDAGLVGVTPVVTRGTATIYFSGTTLTNDSDAANGLYRSYADSQIDNLVVSGTTTPGMMYMTNGTFYVLKNTYIGRDGGVGTLYSTKRCLGRGNSGGANDKELPYLGQRNSANLYLGSASAKGKGFASGTLHVRNNVASTWNIYFGDANNDLPPDDGQEHYAGEVIVDGSSSYLVFLYGYVRGVTDSIIRFKGGNVRSYGWGTFLTFSANSSANLICQGEGGQPIDLLMNKFSSFFSWGSGSTGHLILRGASDVYLYGGDGQGQSKTYTLEGGGSYTDTAGGVVIDDPAHRVDWLQTGGLRFRNSGSKVAKILSSYFWPSNSWNGGVAIEYKSDFYVNLLGTSQACNSLMGGGQLTNGVLARTSTIYIGAHGNDCEFDATLKDGGAIDIVKRGAGTITLKKPIPYTFTLESGRALIPASSTCSTVGTLVTAAGTSIAIQGRTFAPPAGYDMNAADTATFSTVLGGTLEVGGDVDQTVDFSKITGNGILKKTGSGTTTLVNASSFVGEIVVEGGTLAFAASTGTNNFSTVTVAAGATLDLASGTRLNANALSVRGVAGATDSLYGAGGGDATALDGLTGTGVVYVVPASATWTGAVDDDPENLANWTGLASADALQTGLLTVNFSASDPSGAWNVARAYSFKGFVFAPDVQSFAFNKSGEAASLAIGASGISMPDNRSASSPLEFRTPLDFTAIHTTLDFGSNVVARFRAPLGGVPNSGQTVFKVGGGSVYLYSTNSTYDGSVVVSNGYVYAYGNEPFGPVDASGNSKVYVEGFNGARVYLSNMTSSKNFQLHNNATYRTALYSTAHTTNTITGNVRCGDVCKVDVTDGSVLYMDGGYGTASNPSAEYVNWSGNGLVVFRNKPLYCGSFEAAIRNLRLDCTGNVLTKIFAWSDNRLPTYDPYNGWSGTLTFGCDWALDRPAMGLFSQGIVDLNGTEQRIGSFRVMGSGKLRSLNGPGTLRLANTTATYDNVTPSTGDFVGAVNLIVEGQDTFTFGISNRVISATGNVEVASGTLKFCGTASWLGATNVTVSGGTLVVPHSQVFDRYSDLYLTAGALQLNEGVNQKVRYLYLEGSERHARNGRYGALGNTSVPAANRTARITGPGILNVLGEGSGTLLLFR